MRGDERHLWRASVDLFFHLLYDEFAWAYDLVAWLASLGQWWTWGRTALPHLKGERVLELGSGTGHLLVTMAERGLAPVGLDLSGRMGRQARRRAKRAAATVPVVQASAQRLPFGSGCFDGVVATFPTEFIVDPHALQETTRVLEAGGRVVIVAWAYLGGHDPLSRLIRWLYRVTGQRRPDPDRLETLMTGVGLNPRLSWESVGRSAVMLLVADKRSSEKPP